MGEVYRAADTRLGRTVAIKVLAGRASNDPERRRRFEQEARAVSALSHPNICVLYDVGCETPAGVHPSAGDPALPSGPLQFLVMEHVEGETLSKRLRAGGVSFDEALEIGAQIADALAAAHRRGIVHRDLKPGNIMLTRSGSGIHAKLLDFGLARFGPTPNTDLESTHSKHEPDTRPGAVLGTIPYMAPEQLEGKVADARSDIFALGCVLYEMLTGRRAFEGSSEASIISAIMGREPEPVAALQPATPPALEHLVHRCLQKDPEKRCESAHDLVGELRWLRQTHGARLAEGQLLRRRATDSNTGSGRTLSDDSTRRPTGRGRRLAFAAGLFATGILAYGGAAYRLAWWPWSGDPFRNAVPRQVTTESGLQAEPAVSPDGSQIAYVSDGGGTAHIWLVEANGAAKRQLTFGTEADHDPAWDHDGGAVLFTRHRGAQRGIWLVPRLGGNAMPVADDGAQPAVSPDGARLAFVREVAPAGETRVFVAPRQDASRARQVTFDTDGLWVHGHPSWSPDGRWLCYHAQHSLWIVSAEGRGAKRLTFDNESALDPVWAADGKSIYYTSAREGTTALWKIAAGGGLPERLTSGSGPERQPSLSRSGERIAYSTDEANLDIVLHEIATGAPRMIFGTVRVESMPRFSPDRRTIVLRSGQSDGRVELWIKPLSTGPEMSDANRLTDLPGKEVVHPAVSPDGHWVACYRVLDGQRDIWTVPWDGGSAVQITTDPAADIQPAWSHDGKRLAFASERGGGFHIWTVPIANGHRAGSEVRVTRGDRRALAPEWSPDDQLIAYVDDPTTSEAEVWVTRADGLGNPRRVTTGAGAFRIRWVRQNQMVVSGMWGTSTLSLRFVDPATGAPTPFAPPVILGDDPASCDFDIDLDLGLAAFARKTGRGNIWTLSRRQ
jgi:Tol biopolymer transport system component/serine/threonine protein kinase